ncbi:aspartate aminotransferase family protein [Actinocrispum wychmicini]|uniref:Adenosylmethionine-8-amino-7-oxononanoate aminotransferase n=1 Tax=Actinocrispum wychmicini TaxID=1213861 RepID=A0A4R2J5X3_9PSEU|nr:aminotransferase class III-fold pyridoxal phosphate-dependent enzyme [Actinocrispum wychmicini]TCO54351.1 adenosylmethionine-8-amino-7-oxononanoate aminotransferase [Actinocrispum wychmicini]
MADKAQRLWHPFADMSRIPGHELVLARGEGCWLWDDVGRRYLDVTAGLWFANVGHGRAEIADAAAAQLRSLAAYSIFDRYANEPALALADRLAAIAPIEDAAVFFTSGGSDSVDTAAKMARRYWQLRGHTERTVIVARTNAYHGMHGFGTALAGIPGNAAGWGQIMPDVLHVPHDDHTALAAVFAQHGTKIAAVIGEPVIAAGGVYPPVEGYWKQVRALCDEYDTLLIADEVVTGYGRLGSWFASDLFEIRPDLVTTAKGLTSGYLPLGAVLVGPRVRDELWSAGAGMFRHGYTYSGHAAACAAALSNLDILEHEDLAAQVRRLTPVLAAELDSLRGLPAVREVRHVGLLGAVQLAQPEQTDTLVARLRERGMLLRGLVGHSIQISPPFVITETELRKFAAVLAEELTELGRDHAA